MKRSFVVFLAMIAFCFGHALASSVEGGEEVWQRETYKSGESVYYSGVWGGFNTNLLVGERGVGLVFLTMGEPKVLQGKYPFTIDDDAPIFVEVVRDDRIAATYFRDSRSIANRLANATKAKLEVRICGNRGPCYFSVNGGDTEVITWHWKEPLTKTFPDFEPLKLK